MIIGPPFFSGCSGGGEELLGEVGERVIVQFRGEGLGGGAMAMTAAAVTVPLGVLLRREVTSERMERPDVLCGEAARSRKGEDFTLLLAEAGERVAGDPSTSFSVFAVPHCPYARALNSGRF